MHPDISYYASQNGEATNRYIHLLLTALKGRICTSHNAQSMCLALRRGSIGLSLREDASEMPSTGLISC